MNFNHRIRMSLCMLIAAAVSSLVTCTNFSSQYERIENSRIRMIDFIYEPPEAAPGDTVRLKALFGGKNITPENIDWKVSFKVVINAYGFDTAFEEQPLTYISETCSTSENTSCIALSFVIPENCIRESPMVQNDWMALLPDTLKKMLPQELTSQTKQEMLGSLDSIAKILAVIGPEQRSAVASGMPGGLVEGLPLVMQLFTTKIRLFAYIKNSHRIRSDYTVSYTPRFSLLPGLGVYENRNPAIDSVGVYKVRGDNLMDFDRSGDNTEYTTLTTRNDSGVTIEAENGYTYFLEAFVSGRDSALTLYDIAYGQSVSREELTADWMFQMDDDETSGLIANDFMNISSLNDLTAILSLPRKEEVRKFTIWVQVTDSRLNVLNRSQGSTVAEVHGEFLYP